MTTTSCPHCGSTFEPLRRNAKYCSPRCKQGAKDARRKPSRLARDRRRNGVRPTAYRTNDPASVAAKFGFEQRDGYTKRVRPKVVTIDVDEVIDREDDFADYMPPVHTLPVGVRGEIAF